MSSKKGFEICILSTRWSKMTNMPWNCGFLQNWRLKINFTRQKWTYSNCLFHRLLILFNVRFLCLIVRLWDFPQNRESYIKTMRLERSARHVVPFQCVVQCKTIPLTLYLANVLGEILSLQLGCEKMLTASILQLLRAIIYISKCLSQLNSSCVAMSLILVLPFFS